VADPSDPDAARRTAEQILAGREFQPPKPSLLERFGTWLGHLFDRLFPDVSASGRAGAGGFNIVGWLLLGALIVGLVGLIVWALRRRSPRQKAAKPAADKATVVIDRSREPDEWRTLAAEHAAAGRWRDALRCRYRALVGDLARRGRLDEIPGRTTGEERAQLSATTPQAAESFTPATELFDRVWYGAEPAGRDELDRFTALEEQVLSEAGR
jgi:hypothetical protein